MKNLSVCLLFVISLFGCTGNEPSSKLDANAMISIRPAVGTVMKAPSVKGGYAHLTALEIIRCADNIKFRNEKLAPNQAIGAGVSDAQRDTVNMTLKMWGIYVINTDNGGLQTTFIEATDCVIQNVISDYPNSVIDTVAYIPNSVLRIAEIKIKDAYSKNDYTEVYRLFNEAFTFIPISGAEWRNLRLIGQN